jgi:hypothetical protein
MCEYERFRTFNIKLTNLVDPNELQPIRYRHHGDICVAGNLALGFSTTCVQCCREIVTYLKLQQIDFIKTIEITYLHTDGHFHAGQLQHLRCPQCNPLHFTEW